MSATPQGKGSGLVDTPLSINYSFINSTNKFYVDFGGEGVGGDFSLENGTFSQNSYNTLVQQDPSVQTDRKTDTHRDTHPATFI